MKTIARSDNNQSVMTDRKETPEELYGEGYFPRVYRTSLVSFVVLALILGGRWGWPGLIGLSYGAAISLGSLRAIEWAVRALFQPGVRLNPRFLVALIVLKLPLLAVVLAGGAWLAVHQLANPFALAGGVVLVQAVMFLKAVGSLLVAHQAGAPAWSAAPWMNAEHWRALAASGRASSARERARAPRREPLPVAD